MRAALAMVAVALLTAAAPASAQSATDVARAKEAFHAGASAYAAGDYLAAIQALETSYALTPLPAIAFSLAQAERKQYLVDGQREHLDRAIALFHRYLNEAPEGSRHDDAREALSQLEKLQPAAPVEHPPATPAVRATRLMIVADAPGARIELDGAPSVASPLIKEVSPGRHRVRVTARGFGIAERAATAVPGELILNEIRLQELPSRLTVYTPEGADVYVDGIFNSTSLDHVALPLPAGTHHITVAQKGHQPVSETVELARGESRNLRLSPDQSTQRTISYVLLAGGGVGLGASFVLSSLAVRSENRAEDYLAQRTRQNTSAASLINYRANAADRDRFRLATEVGLATSAGMFITGLFLHELDDGVPYERQRGRPGSSEPEPLADSVQTARSTVRFAPVVTASTWGASVQCQF